MTDSRTAGNLAEDILTVQIEREAILKCQHGDRESFRRVLDFHGDHLYRIALLITRDPAKAEEAVQETLIRAWKKIRTFKVGRPLRPWLNRMLVNCISNLNSRKQLERVPEEMAFSVADTGLSPEQSALNSETAAMLQAALKTLSVEHRTVLVLRFFNDLSLPEIAESTGWRVGTVKSRLHRATSALRDAVAASESFGEPRLSGEEA